MEKELVDVQSGHSMFSKIGKRVLRPGGKKLTLGILEELNISETDHVVEFAPGIGFTAMEILNYFPKSYTGIEVNDDIAHNLKAQIKGPGCRILAGNAVHTNLRSRSASKLYEEAMLTMQTNHRKENIIGEACRILKTGGLYAIHELCFTPDNLPESTRKIIRKDLAKNMNVTARPLTKSEWIQMIEKEGFRVKQILYSPMALLETKQLVEDEGFLRALKIGYNVIRQRAIQKQLISTRTIFKKYQNELKAIGIIAEKV